MQVAESSFFYPDATVICDAVDPHAISITKPRVVGEVLSPSTKGYDLVDKRAAYRAMTSLEFYIVVYTDKRRLEIDRRRSDGTWSTETYDLGGEAGDRMLSIPEIYVGSSLAP